MLCDSSHRVPACILYFPLKSSFDIFSGLTKISLRVRFGVLTRQMVFCCFLVFLVGITGLYVLKFAQQ